MKCEVKHNGDMGIYGLMGGGAMLKKLAITGSQT